MGFLILFRICLCDLTIKELALKIRKFYEYQSAGNWKSNTKK